MKNISYLQALNEALREEMTRDERVYIAGEDVGLFGGGMGVTQGLYQDFGGDRVKDTPISAHHVSFGDWDMSRSKR